MYWYQMKTSTYSFRTWFCTLGCRRGTCGSSLGRQRHSWSYRRVQVDHLPKEKYTRGTFSIQRYEAENQLDIDNIIVCPFIFRTLHCNLNLLSGISEGAVAVDPQRSRGDHEGGNPQSLRKVWGNCHMGEVIEFDIFLANSRKKEKIDNPGCSLMTNNISRVFSKTPKNSKSFESTLQY